MFRKKNLISSLLNVLGMTAAFAAMYVILVQVHHDFSYNKGLKNHENICVVSCPSWFDESKFMTAINRPAMEGIISNVAGIEAGGTAVSSIYKADVFLESESDNGLYDRNLTSNITTFSKGALDVFGIEFVKGGFEDLLPNQNHVAIEESEAERMGLDVGSVFMLSYGGSSRLSYEVRAIYKDMPGNTLFDTFKIFSNIGDVSIADYQEWSYQYYLKLPENVQPEDMEKAMYDYMKKTTSDQYPGLSPEALEEELAQFKFRLVPVADTYFDEALTYTGEQGNRVTTITLLAVAVLVIIIAFINYVNFFMAMVPIRIKSVNTRKILGSSRGEIIGGFIRESLTMILISLALAAVAVIMFKASSLAGLIGCNIAFGVNVGVVISTVLLAIIMAVVACIYPALYITSFNPAMVIRGSFSATSGGKQLRYSLIGLQFIISIALIVCSMFINIQRSYMLKHDMGFDRENLLVANVSWNIANNSAEAVTSSLNMSPFVKDITWANGDLVANSRMGWGRDFKGEMINFQCYPVSWNFLRVMGIDIIEGRDFSQADELSENGVFIFNKAARDDFGLTLEDRMVGHITETEIVGFCENFNFQSLQSDIQPFCLYIFGANAWRNNNTIFVRTEDGANLGEVMTLMRETIAEFDPETPVDEISVEIFDQKLAKSYYREQNLSKLITLFTILAIAISLMGVFGLVMFETEYRRKEIGVRRVNGATVTEILAMFNMKFVRIVLICFVIAAPLSWLVMDRYLSGFAYRVPLYIWVFLVALLAVLAITVAVVTLRSLRASTQNPVDALRNE